MVKIQTGKYHATVAHFWAFNGFSYEQINFVRKICIYAHFGKRLIIFATGIELVSDVKVMYTEKFSKGLNGKLMSKTHNLGNFLSLQRSNLQSIANQHME